MMLNLFMCMFGKLYCDEAAAWVLVGDNWVVFVCWGGLGVFDLGFVELVVVGDLWC